ncbi:type VI secretion system-associated FHA domain protein [Pendulispora albinea]|uniref:FHA domain-containing protein n=1 Tax=Pendulispora albinea TaxID=2741071 RepID=A0ABZ2LNP1_9BACT
MTQAVQLRVYNVADHRSFEYVTDRFPVLIGRDPKVSACILEDDLKVSRVHAGVDLRGDEIFVRDGGSANGTFVNGQRLSDRWVSLGPANHEHEIRIGNWLIRAQRAAQRAALPGQTSFGADTGASVANFNETFGGLDGVEPSLQHASPSPGHPATTGAHHAVQQTTDGLRILFDCYEAAARELYTRMAAQLEAMPPAARVAACRQIQAAYPSLSGNDAFVQLFRHYGASPEGAQTPETVALKAVQYLSQWYIGQPVTRPREIIAFCDKVRQAVDELLLGHVPLLAGLEKFEQQMALAEGDEAFSLPHTPAEFSRALFDWTDPTDRASRALRRSFADLMVHQVGMLNGVMRGVKALLVQLAPDSIQKSWHEHQARRTGIGRLLGSFRKAPELLSIYAKRHSDLADEENETFRLIFGREFVEEYKQFAREQGSETSRATAMIPATTTGSRQLLAAAPVQGQAQPPAGAAAQAGPAAQTGPGGTSGRYPPNATR